MGTSLKHEYDTQSIGTIDNKLIGPLQLPYFNHETNCGRKEELIKRIIDLIKKEVVCQFCQKVIEIPIHIKAERDVDVACNICSSDLKYRRNAINTKNEILCLNCTL